MINSGELHINNIQLVWRSVTVHSTFPPKKPKTDSSDDSATSLVSCLRTLSVANITQPRWYRNEMLAGGRRGTLRVGKTEGDRPSAIMPTQNSHLKEANSSPAIQNVSRHLCEHQVRNIAYTTAS